MTRIHAYNGSEAPEFKEPIALINLSNCISSQWAGMCGIKEEWSFRLGCGADSTLNKSQVTISAR